MSIPTHDIYIALGANLGNPLEEIRQATLFLQSLTPYPIKQSSLWLSAPIDCPQGSPPFLNAVISLYLPSSNPNQENSLRLQTDEAFRLLDTLHQYEIRSGRPQNHTYHSPRIIDLDLIYFKGIQIQTKRLTLPHPRAMERRFVLEPLNELNPELRLSSNSSTIKTLTDQLRNSDQLIEKYNSI